LVAFEGEDETLVERLLCAREVQRLRGVKALGLTSLVFLGAEHSRFGHALGTAHVMLRLLERVAHVEGELPVELRVDASARADALAAAMLHDLGHGPFSHLFEEILPGAIPHEVWTTRILRSPETEVHAALEAHSEGMAERVAGLLEGRHRLGYLARAVSGTLDGDRADYLLRDSHMTGVRYGLYDLDWLLRALAFAQAPGQGEWVLAIDGRKGLPPIESFFLGRQFMYDQVYHHKATRAAEALIRALFVRLSELVRCGEEPERTPTAIRAATHGDEIALADYLDLDDICILSCLADWEHAKDPTLSDLARRFRARVLPKTLPLPAAEPEVWEPARERVEEIVRAAGFRPDLSVWLDVPHDTPYSEPEGDGPKGLWVRIRHQPLRRLGEASFLLGHLKNARIDRPRLIFPAEVRADVRSAMQGILQ
jgi:HD superfamily phosphohydrolase